MVGVARAHDALRMESTDPRRMRASRTGRARPDEPGPEPVPADDDVLPETDDEAADDGWVPL